MDEIKTPNQFFVIQKLYDYIMWVTPEVIEEVLKNTVIPSR
jgi:hypothetical protein